MRSAGPLCVVPFLLASFSILATAPSASAQVVNAPVAPDTIYLVRTGAQAGSRSST
jgi:hypothetical protein